MNHPVRHTLQAIQERVHAACQSSGRDPAGVRLLAVSKTQPAAIVREAVAAGQLLFGENRVGEARDKIPLVASPQCQWHLIGHLQRNKVKEAVALFQMIHSVDSLPLAQELSRAVSTGGVSRDPADALPVLIQVNIGAEPQKHGVLETEAEALARAIAKLPGMALRGLMTIPPQTSSAAAARPYFRALAILARHITEQRIPGVVMEELSMGMSPDFEVAIEEGATLVRVGSALFGQRVTP